MNRLTSLAIALALAAPTLAQDHPGSRVDLAFNRYYTHDELNDAVRRIADAYPELVRVERIGTSRQGREMLVAILNNPETGPDTSKPAMWIDGNVHGNEIQSSEVTLYALWYLVSAYGSNKAITEVVDECAFYFLTSQNPDGRDYWFNEANTSSSSRQNQRPVDNDRDGLFDEDPPDDLDGDGSITSMWKADASGEWVRDRFDPRVFTRVPPGEKGDWTFLGQEGIDNDGDGRINEDGAGGDDMNRNWPSGWEPTYIQFGAGEYPLSNPETRAIADFMLAHPNIAATQSYHNTGGMILRGPGAAFREDFYPRADQQVYDAIANVGAEMLPYYRSMVIHRDLYTVHGGFVNWAAEGLGIVSFTNELWTTGKLFQREVSRPSEAQQKIWRDHVALGATFKDYEEHEHPEHGTVLIGGPNKWDSRVTPNFMLEEECHRNFAFTTFHASHMPRLVWDRTRVRPLDDGLWELTVEIRNRRLIPTRLEIARLKGIGRPDILTCEVDGGEVVSSGRVSRWSDRTMNAVRHDPARLVVDEGIGSHGSSIFRFIIAAPEGATASLTYQAEKARDIETTVELTDPDD